MHINAPNEKPATQHVFELVLYCCSQSKTLAASLNSPSPSSKAPSLFPTPLKLKRIVEKPLLIKGEPGTGKTELAKQVALKLG